MHLFTPAGRSLVAAGLLILLPLISRAAPATGFGAGNVVVYRIGDGSPGSISSTGSKVFLDEYSPLGGTEPIQSIELPSSSTTNLIAGSGVGEGQITRSADGQYLLLTGYDRALGGAGALDTSDVPRMIARVGSTGVVELSAPIPRDELRDEIRCAASHDGTFIWVVTGQAGVSYTEFGSASATKIAEVPSSPRQLRVAFEQLYVSAITSPRIVAAVGSGLPTSEGQTLTNLVTGSTSFAGFLPLDLDPDVSGVDTLYVAQDGTTSVLKFCLVNNVWTPCGSITTPAGGYRGLTGTVSGGTVTLFATNSSGLGSAADSTGYNGVASGFFSTIASAGTNKQFRGVALAPNASTAVRLDSFEAISTGAGTEVRWRTGYEAENLGFHLYRSDGATRSRVNDELIPGSALTGVGRSEGAGYSYHDSAGGGAYYLEDVDLRGHTTLHGPFYTRPGPARAAAAPTFRAASADPGPEPRTLIPLRPGPVVSPSSLAANRWLKLEVSEEGLYRVTGAELLAAGIPRGVDPRSLRLFTEGREAAIRVSGEADRRLQAEDALWFYGLGRETRYSRSRVYWLTWGRGVGRRIRSVGVVNARPGSTAFPYTLQARERSVFFASLMNGPAENFFGPPVTAGGATQRFRVTSHVPGTAGTLQVSLQGVTSLAAPSDHQIRVLLNGASLGQVAWDGHRLGRQSLVIPLGLLQEGENEVTLRAEGPSPDVSLLDSVRLTYLRRYELTDPQLRFTATGGSEIVIEGAAAAEVLDVTDPENPVRPPARPEGAALRLRVPGRPRDTRILFASLPEGRPVERLRTNAPSRWVEARNRADLVILAPAEWSGALEPLRQARQAQGLRSIVVGQEDVYDEFAWGHVDGEAVRRFLQQAHTRWAVRPRYVLLVGDTTYDPKDYLGFGTAVGPPTGAVEAGSLETASDDWLADFDFDGVPELAVGRLPARTASEAAAVVNRWLQKGPAGAALFASDLPDSYPFAAASQRAAAAWAGPSLELRRTGGAHDRTALFTALAQGPRVVAYSGHGSIDFWRGNLLTNADAPALPGPEGGVWLLMTCLNGYFASPSLPCLGERLLMEHAGAVWASSGYCNPEVQDRAQAAFLRALGSGATAGDAARQAKHQVGDRDLRLTWVLLGDPTTRAKS